jgi:hypothetical protein
MRKPRVAVCLFGQYRTGDYCLPWIREQWSFADAVYYVGVKTDNTYANLKEYSASALDIKSVKDSVFTHLKPLVMHLSIQEQDPLTGPGYWHYAPMFRSMQRILYSALRHSVASGIEYDWIVLQRTDVLIGPGINTLKRAIPSRPHESDIWTINPSMGQIKGEARSGGVHDVFLLGSPQAMSLLVSGTFEATAGATVQDWRKFFFTGPNVFLRKCADQANISLQRLNAEVAIVRPNADLEIPVFKSFEHHEKFWRTNHKGMG